MQRMVFAFVSIFIWCSVYAKSALVVVAPHKFMDSEYKNTVRALKRAGIEVHCGTIHGKVAKGSYGMKLRCEVNLEKDPVKGFDAIVFIGGSGVPVFFENKHVLDLIRNSWNEGKVIAAICWAPAILARAGILKGKRVTSWRGAKGDLKRSGAIWVKKLVVTDGRIVTGSGPAAARSFGKAVARLLKETKR